MAQAFRAAGMADSAQVIERELLAAGQARAATDGLSDTEIFDLATRQYNDKNYAEAATTYARLLSRSPYHRDALFAQANCYLAPQNGPGLIGAAAKLVAIEPLGEYNYHCWPRATSSRRSRTSSRKRSSPSTPCRWICSSRDSRRPRTTRRSGPRRSAGKPGTRTTRFLPPRPITIVVEFLAKDGSVVGSPGEYHPRAQAGRVRLGPR